MKHITGQWPNQTRDYGPPLYDDPAKLHYENAADYGPHICSRCWGAGWMRSEVELGTLIRCGDCDAVKNRQLGRCWALSNLKPGVPDAPTLRTPHAGQEAMFDAARRFVQHPAGWLTLHGAWGAGKSYVAEAITRAMLRRKVPCALIRAPDLFVYLGAVERRPGDDTDFEGRMRHLCDLDVLVVDELGKETSSDAVIKLRTRLLDSRYRAERPTVLISNDAPAAWPDPAIASRASDTRFAVIAAPAIDYRRVARRPAARTEGQGR